MFLDAPAIEILNRKIDSTEISFLELTSDGKVKLTQIVPTHGELTQKYFRIGNVSYDKHIHSMAADNATLCEIVQHDLTETDIIGCTIIECYRHVAVAIDPVPPGNQSDTYFWVQTTKGDYFLECHGFLGYYDYGDTFVYDEGYDENTGMLDAWEAYTPEEFRAEFGWS
jgi:hypothetical protein